MKKIILGIKISIIIVMIIAVIVYKDLKDKDIIDTKVVMIGNMIASYEYIDRNIDLDYFYDFNVNTTYERMLNEIGKPNGAIGSGITMPY